MKTVLTSVFPSRQGGIFLVSHIAFYRSAVKFPSHLECCVVSDVRRFRCTSLCFPVPTSPVLREQWQGQDTHKSPSPVPSTEASESGCIAAVLFPPPVMAR